MYWIAKRPDVDSSRQSEGTHEQFLDKLVAFVHYLRMPTQDQSQLSNLQMISRRQSKVMQSCSGPTVIYSSSLWPAMLTISVSKTGAGSVVTSRLHQACLLTEYTVGRDRSHSSCTIAIFRLDGQRPLVARAHVQQTLVPTLDDLSLTNVEGQWLTAVV